MELGKLKLVASKFKDAEIKARTHVGIEVLPKFPELIRDISFLSNKLQNAGISKGQLIGLQATNCYEWLIWDLAALEIGAKIIAFAEDDRRNCSEKITEYNLSLLICSREQYEQAGKVAGCYPIDHVFDASPDGLTQLESQDFETTEFGVTNDQDDLHTKVFSSGTSGHIKGLNISRKGSEYLISKFNEKFNLTQQDSTIIFLPLANYQQRLIAYSCLLSGASFCITDIQSVFFALREYRPSFLIAPPVIYEKLLMLSPEPAMLAESIGDNVRFLITGMAPIDKSLIHTYHENNVLLIEAYGVTETGLIAFNTPDKFHIGSVGQPLDVNHLIFTDENEIVINRQYPLSKGYFECKEGEDTQTFRPDGTIATGDIGYLDDQGFLHLNGRKKDIIITSAGVKLHPAEIEQALTDSNLFSQIAVFYSESRSCLCAVIVTGHKEEEMSEILEEKIEQHFDRYNANAPAYKKVPVIIYSDDEFSASNNLMTQNLKLNRTGIYQRFEQQTTSHI